MNKPTINPSANPTSAAALVNGTSTRRAKPHGVGQLQVEDPAEARSRALLAAVVAFRDGDFTVRLPADWAGTDGRIAEAFNQALAHEDRIAREVARLAVMVGKDGRLQQRMSVPGAIGGWAQKVDSLNTLLDDLVRPTTEVARTIGAVVKGDLGQSMELEVDGRALKGGFLRSAKLVNSMIEQLSVFTSEVTRVAREVGTEGKLGGLLAAVLDLTERHRAEAAQHENERNYRALAIASSAITYRMSADWSTMLPLDGRQFFESSDQPLTDWAWVDQYLPRNEHPRVRKAISEAIARKTLFELEHRVRRPDGSIGWTCSRAVPILDENQEVIEWFGAASDITERKRIELNLIHAIAIAEEANRAKSEFLSSMSHELRTPLNAILGFAQMMESGTPAPTLAQKRSLDQILKGGWYLLDLINGLLDLALIESAKFSVKQEPVSLAEVMLECQALCEPQARERGIDMTFPSFEVLGCVRADRTRVKQVVINLLSNAIKYNNAQGAVAVEWTLSPPDAIRISVRDTGEGLAPEQLSQLFQPFNRLGQEAGPQAGTGIGLVMAKRLVEAMGGAIGADSVVGVGSVFWFELKRASAPQFALLQAEGPVPVPVPMIARE